MTEYHYTELINELDYQAQKMRQLGLVEKSIIDLKTFNTGVVNIATKIINKKISVKTNTGIPLLLVMPLSMITFDKLLETTNINFEKIKIDVKNLQAFEQPKATETLHALLDIQEYKIKKGEPQSKADTLYNIVRKKDQFGFSLAQAINMVNSYPGILNDEQAIDIAASRIAGQIPSIINIDSRDLFQKGKILLRQHWEASPFDLLIPHFKGDNIITADY